LRRYCSEYGRFRAIKRWHYRVKSWCEAITMWQYPVASLREAITMWQHPV